MPFFFVYFVLVVLVLIKLFVLRLSFVVSRSGRLRYTECNRRDEP
nr:MAG TPA: hypothetical protein [Caudoviricetes sp.]DAT92180.1 MAG TPA: hypothetical protein [Caudoviricetes sp.]DAW12554.1 MAG TPA: hypothetical protein [Caudoviricetes sp.]